MAMTTRCACSLTRGTNGCHSNRSFATFPSRTPGQRRDSAGTVAFGTLKEELMLTLFEMFFVQPPFERPFRGSPFLGCF